MLIRQNYLKLLAITAVLCLSACASQQTHISEGEGLLRKNSDVASVEFACESIHWNDIVLLVSPYQEDNVQAAFIQQGLSSDYKVAIAAKIALEDSARLPNMIRGVLESIVYADC